MDDKTIIGLYLNRDQEAIRCTEALYGRRLFSLALRILENDQDAEESVSDTYWQAWNTIPPQKPRYFFAYLAKICRNFAFKKLPRREHKCSASGQFFGATGPISRVLF